MGSGEENLSTIGEREGEGGTKREMLVAKTPQDVCKNGINLDNPNISSSSATPAKSIFFSQKKKFHVFT